MKPAIERWNRVASLYSDLQLLRRDVWCGMIDRDLPRGILWKVLMVYNTLDQSRWSAIDNENRKRYQKLQETYNMADQSEDNVVLDPLSENRQSNSDSRSVIHQDVERTFPEMKFFRSPHIQDIISRILYIYSNVGDVGYRQGMHELVGPILWVLMQEDDVHAEPDTFLVFEAIMKHATSWYKPSPSNSIVPHIVLKSQHIQESIIKNTDPDLYQLLVKNEIEPQIWGIRYIRLMFGREFVFHKTLELWDALFAADNQLQLVDYVCAVMLIRVRNRLLNADSHSEILTTLLRYPTNGEAPHHYVVNALYLQRHPDTEGGAYVARQYAELFPERARTPQPPSSPRINFETIVGAAKTVSKNWDMERLRDAIDEYLVATPSPSPANNSSNKARDNALAETLAHSLKVLEQLDTTGNPELEFALEGVRHARECLVNPERPPIVFEPPSAKSNPTSPTPSRTRTTSKQHVSTPPTTAPSQSLRSPIKPSSMSPQSPQMAQTQAQSHPQPPSGPPSAPQSPQSRPSSSGKPRRTIADSEYSWMLGDAPSSKSKPSANVSTDPFDL